MPHKAPVLPQRAPVRPDKRADPEEGGQFIDVRRPTLVDPFDRED